MRVLITGDIATPGAVARALDAVHNKRRIVIVMHVKDTAAAGAAESWANSNGVLFATIEQVSSPEVFFDLADSIIAFPGTRAGALELARERGVKVWEPYKQQSAL